MVKTAIVDDTDPNIVYDVGWVALNRAYSDTSNEFNSTFRYGSENGLTIRYAFRGSGISVYGTISQPTRYGLPGSTYSIDGEAPVRFNASGEVAYPDPTISSSHIPFYRSLFLPYGDHSILITIDNVNETERRRYFFDFFTVHGVEDDDNAQGSGATNGPGYQIVDDTDWRVIYSEDERGGWESVWSPLDYEGTTRRTPSGRNGTATLTFHGSHIAVYGRIFGNYGAEDIAQFVIDGAIRPIVRMTSVQGLLADRRHQPLLIMDDEFDDGEHRLVVTSLGERAPQWYLDYFVYGSSRGRNTAGGVGVTQTMTSPDPLLLPSSNSSSAGSHNDASSTTQKAAVIAGATIGSVSLLALLIFLFVYWVRRRGSKQRRWPGEHDASQSKDTLQEEEKETATGKGGGVDRREGTMASTRISRQSGTGGGTESDEAAYSVHSPPGWPERLAPPLETKRQRHGTQNGSLAPRGSLGTTFLTVDSSFSSPIESSSTAVAAAGAALPPVPGLPHSPTSSIQTQDRVIPLPTTPLAVVSGGDGEGSRPRLPLEKEDGTKASYSNSATISSNQLQPIVPPYLDPTSSPRGHSDPAGTAREEEDASGGEGLVIGREVDAGIRLDPMQFNLVASDMLPPLYSAATYSNTR